MADVLKNATKRIKIRKKSKSQCEDDGRRSPRPPTTSDHCSTMDPEREKEIFKVFQTFDLDGNGTISVKEMVTCLNAMGKKITFDEVVEKFHRIDKDGNHEVDYDGKASPNANVKNKVQLSRDTTHIQEFKKMMES